MAKSLTYSSPFQVYDGAGGLRLHPGPGFTGSETPNIMLSADSGEMVLRDAIHQCLRIILKLRIFVLLPVSTLPCVVKFKNYS
jgi:hypothetical protein